ncbi:transcription initiation factor TFIID subunit 11 [Coemansia sp. RSA 2706]|nr:transcription initiation factor TFIID subunit 11 [Coemansia sp. RSA 2711]KAJ2286189.1 transcription initiation factor TFIID subunit 11 [Coemansia sp. RSA 2706]KAJ2296671.1 transcription initiation factor TFIID subunit 11 [Coemansia sp. RSA 2705]KAJ2303440.1 transcription initiation factor TFIID subunit 11 [Coemansia sp. RSA 2704]KAJ2311624.1 transcription initiation factor TFIID subunit 11 [Coemansia sp. RSA 2702]KAJ2709850.1 transcription initiation factor TFIID subunit 11 [Coemansia sp. C
MESSRASTPNPAKKRPRLTAVTPLGLLQQRKRRAPPAKPPATPLARKPSKPETTNDDAQPADKAESSSDDDDDVVNDNDDVSLVRQSKEDVRELWEQMTDEQRQRYGVYRQAALNKGTVKKLTSQILNQQVSSTVTFVVAGFAKVFVGDIVERAVEIREARGDHGPLLPEHLRLAYRQYQREQPDDSASGFTKRLF